MLVHSELLQASCREQRWGEVFVDLPRTTSNKQAASNCSSTGAVTSKLAPSLPLISLCVTHTAGRGELLWLAEGESLLDCMELLQASQQTLQHPTL